MPAAQEVTIFWFRRDLRLQDNVGLYHALKENKNVLPLFIYDSEILDQLDNKLDRRVDFISQALQELNKQLAFEGSSLTVCYGEPLQVFKDLIKTYKVLKVYTNHDYEPYAIARDTLVSELLSSKSIPFITYKDQCIFEKTEVCKDDGKPYTVFTPYSVKWKKTLKASDYKPFETQKHFDNFIKIDFKETPSLQSIGFRKTEMAFKSLTVKDLLLKEYKAKRDYPAVEGTSRLSAHLRFGTVSIRALVRKALPLSETWLNELIWRDFYMMILSNFPHVASGAFKKNFDKIEWRNNEAEFDAWCRGATGFPIVDAGMRELNNTGFMHNRVRMIVSSFLVKDLLIDWRWGEAYFAEKLNDFDLSANNGGWQWAAGSGCDAVPYFRVFNPMEQQKKFDPQFEYIKKWIPEFGSKNYAAPIVDHASARKRALAVYKKALTEDGPNPAPQYGLYL